MKGENSDMGPGGFDPNNFDRIFAAEGTISLRYSRLTEIFLS